MINEPLPKTLVKTGAQPLYEQIRDYLLDGIQSGVFQPGDRIPSERDLADQFGVSRLTVNKAVKELERSGFVFAQTGKGTFIRAERYQQQLERLTGFSDDMRTRGYVASSRLIAQGETDAPDEMARILGVLPGARLWWIQRVRLGDGEPVALETAHVVAAACPDLLSRYNFAHESLYRVWRRDYGLTLTHAEQSIEARPAAREEAAALGLKGGVPILAMTRVTYYEADATSHPPRPIEYVQSAYRGDRYKFHVVLRQPGG